MKAVKRFLGVQSPVHISDRVASVLGGFIAIFATFFASSYTLGFEGGLAILPSMGAATVLLFAVPHGQLSTPWALFAGNTISAVAGVTAFILVPNVYLAAACAVGASILLMHFARCIHPPGGATALAFVVGGSTLQNLGYWYVLTPTLVNCGVLFIVAFIFNNRFDWRRYPQSLMRYRQVTYSPGTKQISVAHIRQAVDQAGIVIDTTAEQIKHIADLADQIMRQEKVAGFDLELGAFYTNGLPGREWSVRQVIEERKHEDPSKDMVIYRTVEGANKGISGSCNLEVFATWAREKLRSGS
ncbi:MAG: HPP family protein [Agarilytica sp.]